MRKLLFMCFALLLSSSLFAEQKYSSGDLDIHYVVFNSSFMQPDVAKATNLERSKNVAVLNISLVRAGQGEKGQVTGTITNLLGQIQPLRFKEIDEGVAVYYIAQFPIDSRELLKFDIQVTDGQQKPHQIKFNQEVFPDL